MSNIAQNLLHECVMVAWAKMRKSGSSFRVRIHAAFASITHSLKQLVGMNPGGLASQRMCPFCGLITSRSKSICLECGKQL
jgi:hypothetical protein